MRVGIVSDVHLPYHDIKAWKLTLKILPELNLDSMGILGDFIDFEPISRFVVHPRRRLELKPQIEITRRDGLLPLRAAVPNGDFWYIPGNHCRRLEKYLYTQAPALVDMDALTLPELLQLKKSDLSIRHIPWGKGIKLGKLNCLHGDEISSSSTNPARSLYLKVSTNLLVGHHHKFDRYIHRQFNGEVHGVWVNGTLSRLDVDWMLFPQWTQGFTVVDVTKAGFFHVDQVLFMRRKGKICAMVGGKLFSV